jgi:hypothetical protein
MKMSIKILRISNHRLQLAPAGVSSASCTVPLVVQLLQIPDTQVVDCYLSTLYRTLYSLLGSLCYRTVR